MKNLKPYILLFLVFIFNNIKAQKYFAKTNFHYLNSYSISGGILLNQASHNGNWYKPNKTLLYNANLTILNIKHLNLIIGLGYRKKSIIGYGNYPGMKLINNLSPAEEDTLQPNYNLNFNYLNFDNQFKFIFLEKYKINPFIFVGARFNKLINQSDSLAYYNLRVRDKLIVRDNYFNLFYGIGCNFSINSGFSIQLLFEKNNDNIPNRQVYLNNTSPLKEKEIRYLNYSIQIGLQYNLKQKIK